MIKYIGLDAHSSTCTFSVTDGRGREIDNTTIESNGRLLVKYVRGIEGVKKLTFEECELSNWLYEILRQEVDELIVCNPVANGDYKKKKTDKMDARKLSNLLRGGFLVPVYHDGSKRERFRSLMSGYQDFIEEGVRLKNRYKSLFRKSGKKAKGESLYNDESFLEGLERRDSKFIGTQIYQLLEKKVWGNRILKCVYKMAGHSVLKGKSGLRNYYDTLRVKGISHDNAYNAVCRKIAAISLSVWRKSEKYDDRLITGNLIK